MMVRGRSFIPRSSRVKNTPQVVKVINERMNELDKIGGECRPTDSWPTYR